MINKTEVVIPPQTLFVECEEPDGANDTITLIVQKKYREAARAHTEYVLGARDAIELCNARLRHIRAFLIRVQEGTK